MQSLRRTKFSKGPRIFIQSELRDPFFYNWRKTQDPYPLYSPNNAPWRKPLEVSRFRNIVFGSSKTNDSTIHEVKEQVISFEKKEKKKTITSSELFEQIKKRLESQLSVIDSKDKQKQIEWMIEESLDQINSFPISNSQKEHLFILLIRFFNHLQYSPLSQYSLFLKQEESFSIQLMLQLEQRKQVTGTKIYAELLLFYSKREMIKEAQLSLSSFLALVRKGIIPLSSEEATKEFRRLYHPILFFYSKQKNFIAANEFLQTITNNSPVLQKASLTPYFNQVLEILSQCSEFYRAKQLFLLKDFNFVPNGRTFEILINSCNSYTELDDIIQLMFACSFTYKESTWIALIRAYLRMGDLENALKVLQACPNQTSIIYRAMANTMVQYATFSIKKDTNEYIPLTRAMQAFSLLRNRRLSISQSLLSSIVKAIGWKSKISSEESEFAKIPFAQAKKELDDVWMFGIEKKHNIRRSILDQVIITAGKIGHTPAILRTIQFMSQRNIPTTTSYLALLRAFASLQDLEKASAIFQQLNQQKTKSNGSITNKAFDILCSCIKRVDDLQILLKAFQTFYSNSSNSLSSATLSKVLDICLQFTQSSTTKLTTTNTSIITNILQLTEVYSSRLPSSEQQFINQKKEDIRDFIETAIPL